MKIALVTDLHAEEDFPTQYGVKAWDNWKTILADVESRGVDKIIFLGDIGSEVAHKHFFGTLNDLGIPFRVILGNHDRFEEANKTYNPDCVQNKTEWYWSETIGNFKSIFLDTSTDSISQAQLNWLEKELNGKQEVLLFIHHPVLDTKTTVQTTFPLAGADQLKEILSKHTHSVQIFCGHLHLDDVQLGGNIKQTVNPSASVQIKRISESPEVDHINFAYRLLDIHENQLSSELIWYNADQKRMNL